MDLDLLTAFAAVAETASFSQAAKRLGRPKSSVSRWIARLEEQLDVELLHRTTRQVSLTAAGTALHERVTPLLGALREAVGALPEREEQPSGELRVTAPVDLGSTFLPELVTRFLARYPSVSVDAVVTNDVLDLVGEGIDVALRAAGARLKDSSALVARRAAQLAGYVYASPTYLARRGTPRTPRDLPDHDWVLFRPTGRTLRLRAGEETASLELEGRIRGNEFLFVREAVRAGAGLGVLPSFLAGADAAAGHLVPVLPRWSMDAGTLWIVTTARRHVPRKVTAFVDLVRETLRARPLSRPLPPPKAAG